MTPETIQRFASVLSLAGETRSTPFDDLDSVVALYEPRVFRFLLGTLRDRDAAETLTQETFLRAWTARDSFRSGCSPSTWLLRIALNLARDHTRTDRFRFWKKVAEHAVSATEIASSVPSDERTPESSLLAREQVGRIFETVGQLSMRQRSIFLLRFVEELEIPEIAEATGLPVSTVKSHLYRALAIVRANHSPGPKEGK
ncbi:MAG: RNA polymerase sigma factor [Acidobacteriaceae bacterium]